MPLQESVDRAIRQVKKTKEWAARRGPADLNPEVTVYRGATAVALVVVRDMSPEGITSVANMCGAGFDADSLVLTFEGLKTLEDPQLMQRALDGDEEASKLLNLNPMTGQPWQSGEMQDAYAHHDGVGRGWLIEIINVIGVNRAGDVVTEMLPFRYVGKHLVWKDDDPDLLRRTSTIEDGPGKWRGYIPEALKHGMDNIASASARWPWLEQAIGRDEMDLELATWFMRNKLGMAFLLADQDDKARLDLLRSKGYQV